MRASIFDDIILGGIRPSYREIRDTIVATGKGLEIHAVLTGVLRDALTIESAENNGLRLSYEAPKDYQSSLAQKSFEQTYSVDRDYDVESATATLENGLLVITIPKRVTPTKTKSIKIM